MSYRYTKTIPHSQQQWQQLDELWEAAEAYLKAIPENHRDFNLAKAEYMRRFYR